MKWNFLTKIQLPPEPLPRGYRPQIPVLSVLCPQLNFLNPPTDQNSWIRHWPLWKPKRPMQFVRKHVNAACFRLIIKKSIAFSSCLYLTYIHETLDRNYIWSLPTARSTDFFEKLTAFQLGTQIPTFYGTRKFITAFSCPNPEWVRSNP